MRNETEIRNAEHDLRLWNIKPREIKVELAHQMARKCADAEKTDRHVYVRVRSRLLNGSFCPEDFGFSIGPGNVINGDGKRVSFA